MDNYWNDNYWRRHLMEPERMDIFEDLWIGKHQVLIDSLNKGHVLDLGCGIGQFTDYWLISSSTVVATGVLSFKAFKAFTEISAEITWKPLLSQ